MSAVRRVESRQNPLVKRLRQLAQGGGAARRLGQAWLEGEHLCDAARARAVPVSMALATDDALAVERLRLLFDLAAERVVVPAEVFGAVSALPSPSSIGFVIELPADRAIDPLAPTVVLDGVQDAGNVGSVLRSAAAFGFAQVVALEGTAGLWSPKVLRAGMGAHFGLRLVEGASAADLRRLALPLLATSPHADRALPDADLPAPCAWVLGHEGQGVSPAVAALCRTTVRIPQPGGQESLNVAAAAAVCLYESARRSPGPARQ